MGPMLPLVGSLIITGLLSCKDNRVIDDFVIIYTINLRYLGSVHLAPNLLTWYLGMFNLMWVDRHVLQRDGLANGRLEFTRAKKAKICQ